MANLRANNISGIDGRNAITGSVEFTGNSFLTTPFTIGGDFDFGSENFTIEGWFNANETKRVGILAGIGTTSTSSSIPFQVEISSTNTLKGVLGDGTNAFTAEVGTGLTISSWNHFALVRNGNLTSMYLNGIVGTGTTSISGSLATSGITTVYIGDIGIGSTNRFDGYISNLRVIKGTALYTQNFIPPTKKLIRLPGTALLCCQDNVSVTSEVTGKTITANGSPTATKQVPQVGSDSGLIFDGVTKVNTQNYFYLPTGTTEQRSRGRGVFGGGYVAPTVVNTISYINIQSSGNSIDFGDLFQTRGYAGSCSSSTRGVFGGGYAPGNQNTIDYITISSTANALDFGDLTQARHVLTACSSSTRGVFGAGAAPTVVNTIDFITISSIGNAQDFGDLTQPRREPASCSSSTRGVFGGGSTPTLVNTIDYITIASTGDALDFGDLTQPRTSLAACSSSTRGVFGGGAAPTVSNTIDFITISTLGNAQDFGDLTQARFALAACSSSIRGVFGGGYVPPSGINTIDYITISSTGNALDFGDLTQTIRLLAACSDSHGGLG